MMQAVGWVALERLRPYLPGLRPVAVGQAAAVGVIIIIITIIDRCRFELGAEHHGRLRIKT
jgi:hypothetical protein